MARVELPQSRVRARRRERRLRLAIFGVVLVLILAGALIGASYLPFLQIKDVQVTGAQTVASSSVLAYVEQAIAGKYWHVFPKRNILIYPKQALAAGILAQFPELHAADVHAVNFHTIAAAVIERAPKALWCPGTIDAMGGEGHDCLVMDENGAAYADGDPGLSPIYFGVITQNGLPAQYLTPDDFRALSALVDALSLKAGTTTVDQVEVDQGGDVSAHFTDGFTLKFALADAGGDVFDRFSLALTSDPFKNKSLSDFDYLDLRFGDKLYYKLK